MRELENWCVAFPSFELKGVGDLESSVKEIAERWNDCGTLQTYVACFCITSWTIEHAVSLFRQLWGSDSQIEDQVAVFKLL